MRSSRRHDSRRWMCSLLVVGMIVLLLAGCGPKDTAPSTPSTVEQESEIVIAQGVDATTLDPNMHAEAPTTNVCINIYDTLLMRDLDANIIPALAESYENLDDSTWEFRLRDDVTFHNGEAFDAESVKFTLERILDPEMNSPQMPHLSSIEEVRIIDPGTVHIITREPFPTLPAQLVSRQMVPPEYTREMGHEHLAANPVGTGPYRFVEWTRDEKIVLEANEEYWRGRPAVDRVVFRVIPENSTRMAELQTGSVDLIVNVPPHQAATLEEDEGTAVARVPSSRVIFMGIVSDTPGPLEDVRVRQALNYGIDVQSIVDNVLMGNGTPLAGQPVGEIHFGYNPSLEPYPHDPDRALDLLAEAGYPDGLELNLDSPSGRYLMDKEIAQAAVGQVESIGVDIDLNVLEWGVYVEKIMARQLEDLFLIGWGNSTFDADATLYSWFRTGQRFCFYDNPQIDELLDSARVSMDQQERLQLYHQAMEILSEEAPWVYLHQQLDIYGISGRLDWRARPDELIYAFDARVEQ
ncbi:MAG: ABC transporter substrate-binding protein [Bacillota bacterium]